MAAQPGLTVADVIRKTGVPADDVRIVIVNGQSAANDEPLTDGDRVALFPVVAGG